jgi:hypothetical protein
VERVERITDSEEQAVHDAMPLFVLVPLAGRL